MGELLATSLVAFMIIRVLDGFRTLQELPQQWLFLARMVAGLGAATLYLLRTGNLYLALPAFGAALLLYGLDGLMLAKSDESIHNIMKNRR